MSDKRRHELVELSVDSRLPSSGRRYRDLYFEDDAPLPSLKALDETGMVITLGVIAGSRTAHRMAGAAEPIVQRLADVKMQMDRCERAEPVDVRAIITNGMYDRSWPETGGTAAPRIVTPGENGRLARWNVPSGGFDWMTFDGRYA
ncbi:MAG: hypothetical protein ACLUB5_02970 [Bifidobacterium dentium]